MADFLRGVVRMLAAVVVERLDQRRPCRHRVLAAQCIIGETDQIVGAVEHALRDQMRHRHPVVAELQDRPWRTAGYGLGLMMDIASPLGLCIGHSGQGPDSVAAAYHFPDLDPPITVAAFAPTDDQGIAERAVLEEAARLR